MQGCAHFWIQIAYRIFTYYSSHFFYKLHENKEYQGVTRSNKSSSDGSSISLHVTGSVHLRIAWLKFLKYLAKKKQPLNCIQRIQARVKCYCLVLHVFTSTLFHSQLVLYFLDQKDTTVFIKVKTVSMYHFNHGKQPMGMIVSLITGGN